MLIGIAVGLLIAAVAGFDERLLITVVRGAVLGLAIAGLSALVDRAPR